MSAGQDFSVDLAALTGAAQGIQQLMANLDAKQVKDLDCDQSAFGHDRLGATTSDFCERWDRGVQHLAEDGKEIGDRLTTCVNTYVEAERAALDALQQIGLSSGTDGSSSGLAVQ